MNTNVRGPVSKWSWAGMAMIAMMAGGPVVRADVPSVDVRVEIPVEALFTPELGWDDNDHIQVVTHGALPNGCYTLSEAAVVSIGNNAFLVRQYATKTTNGVCIDETTMPIHMQMRIPFTKVVEIGSLPVGDYSFHYNKVMAGESVRKMNVAKATAPSIDSLPYAYITQQYSSDILNGADDLKVMLSGMLNSTCVELDPNIKVMKENDVFVVLPTLKIKTGVLCAQVLVPFETQINLGKQVPGHYLVHVRSQNGNALNHVVQVMR